MRQLKDKLKIWLKKDRFAHTLRVEKTALALAKHYGANEKKTSLAALLHDCGRAVEGRKLLGEAKKYGLKISAIEAFQPKLIHARLGAAVAKKVFGARDAAVLSAIAKHTVGGDKMGLLDKIIYLADHIESGRRYKGVEKVRKLAFKNMDMAIIGSLGLMINCLTEKGLPLCEQTVRTRNNLLLK